MIKLAQAIGKKHTADGAGSPLAALNMADMNTKTSTADTQNQASAKLYRDAETATQNRDLALGKDRSTTGTVNYYVAAARDMLLSLPIVDDVVPLAPAQDLEHGGTRA